MSYVNFFSSSWSTSLSAARLVTNTPSKDISPEPPNRPAGRRGNKTHNSFLISCWTQTPAMLASDPATRLSVPHAGGCPLFNRSRHQRCPEVAVSQDESLTKPRKFETCCCSLNSMFYNTVLPSHPRHQTQQAIFIMTVPGSWAGHLCDVSSTPDFRLMAG